MRARSRKVSTGGLPVMAVSPSLVPTLGPIRYSGLQSCLDELHPGPPYRSGGPLSIAKTNYQVGYSSDLNAGSLGSGAYWYQGRFYLAPTLIGAPPFSPLSDSSLRAWGVKGYNRGLPVHNVVNLGQAAVECRDFGRMVSSTQDFFQQFKSLAGRSPKFWADAWLNGAFGWKPFISDLVDALTYQRQITARLAYLKSHNRKEIRRHFSLSNTSSRTRINSQETYASLQPVLNSGWYDLSGKHNGMTETWRTDESHIWFDGRFTFNIPGLNVPSIDPRLQAKLMGIVPDMNLLWKVTPWTWLIDWFTSVGAGVQNSSLMQEYGQVARSAYIMSHRKVVYDTYAFQYVRTGGTASSPFTGPLTMVALSSRSSYEVKQRGVASPYGFGVTWDGFNPFQLSILASLGITRGHGGRGTL